MSLTLAICIGLSFLNVIACFYIIMSDGLTKKQKTMQVFWVWCLPLLGAVVVLAILRSDKPFKPIVDRTSNENEYDVIKSGIERPDDFL